MTLDWLVVREELVKEKTFEIRLKWRGAGLRTLGTEESFPGRGKSKCNIRTAPGLLRSRKGQCAGWDDLKRLWYRIGESYEGAGWWQQALQVLMRSLLLFQCMCCWSQHKSAFFFFFLFFNWLFDFAFFRATPTAYGGSQARGPFGATAAGLYHSHSNTRSLTQWVRPGIEPTTSCS